MTTQDSKVIPLNAVHSPSRQRDRTVDEIEALYLKHLAEIVPPLFAVIDDELFRRSDKAENIGMQTLYFEAMRYIRVEAAEIQKAFLEQAAARYQTFWKTESRPFGERRLAERGTGMEQDFSLLEKDALEEQLAVTSMAAKGSNLFQRDLYALNKRCAALSGRDTVETPDNPLGPWVLCQAFDAALKPLSLDVAVKLLIFKLFDYVVLSALGPVYGALNEHLANAGILPTLPKGIRRATAPTTREHKNATPQQPSAGPVDEQREPDTQVYAEVFLAMQNLLDGWRMRMGLSPSYSNVSPAVPAFETADVLSALSVMQHPAMPDSGAAAEGLKLFLQENLKKLQPTAESRPLAPAEEDIIDMVSMIFDFILEDRNLPDPVKALIARLQIPVVKVAILEKSFFGRKNHPVRLLLNALAHAGLGLDVAENSADNPIFQKIKSVVTRILDEFEQNVDLFSELLDEFLVFMEKEAQRSRIAEERTRQVTQSKEHLHLAKRKVAYEIAIRLQGKTVPSSVRSFLFNTWKDVLVLAYLRRDKQSDDWEGAIHVMDELIWTVTEPMTGKARKDIMQAIPPLLKAVRVRLEALSLDPQAVSSALKELEAYHLSRLSSGSADAGAAEPTPVVEIRDPDLAQAIIEIRNTLPDVEGFDVADLAKVSGQDESLDPAGSIVDEAALARVRDMAVGEWIEIDQDRKRIRAKLSWKSAVTSTYVFVNRKGVKVVEIPLTVLAKRLCNGTVRIIEGSTTPLMDRALNALLNTLRNPLDGPRTPITVGEA